MTEIIAYGYTSESTWLELSNEYLTETLANGYSSESTQ